MALPCVMELAGWGDSCQVVATPSQRMPGYEFHHIREGHGAAQRADDFLGWKFCWGHHAGPNGYHGLGKRGFEARYKLTEFDLLAIVYRALEIQRQMEMSKARAA